jgi:hypothetical protein
MVNDIVTTVPLSDLMNKTPEERMELVGKAIKENDTLNNTLTAPAASITDSPASS